MKDNTRMKELFIIRGLPGSGKTTFARSIADLSFSADDYFYQKFGKYSFDPKLLPDAHKWCARMVEMAMSFEHSKIAVANTFTEEWEFQNYIELAKFYGYRYHVLTVENYHGNKSIHDVPENVIDSMKERYTVKL